MAVNGTVLGTVSVATVANIYGAVKKDKPADVPIIGGFVVALFLLGLAETKAQKLAVAFAVAFFITSLSLNATDLLTLISNVTSNGESINEPSGTPNPPTQAGHGSGPSVERHV